MALRQKYFVLRLESKHSKDREAQAAREALRTYADEIADYKPKIAEDIRVWVAEEAHKEKKLKDRENEKLVAADMLILQSIDELKKALMESKEKEDDKHT